MPSFSSYVAIPTGGAIILTFDTASVAGVASGSISLSRAVSGVGGLGAFTTLYAGPSFTDSGSGQIYLDAGDKLPAPLSASTLYVYQITDIIGSVQTDPIEPVAGLTLEGDHLTSTFLRMLQAGVTNLIPPTGVGIATVTFAPPQGSVLPLPMVVIFPQGIDQEDQKIGDDYPQPDNNNIWTISELARHKFKVSVLGKNASEMLYYRNAIIGIFKVICAYVLNPIGENVTHNYHAEAVEQTKDSLVPGLVQCDVFLEAKGIFNIAITSTIGLIETIDVTGSDGTQVVIQTEVPLP